MEMANSMGKWYLPSEFDAEKLLIVVSVVGTGRGESIILNICQRFVGIVDSCEEILPQNASNWRMGLMKHALSACIEPVFGFVLLTHPHYDHFAGMERIFRVLQDRALRIVLFQGTTEYELAEIFRAQQAVADRGRTAYQFYKRFASLLRVYHEDLSAPQRARAADNTVLASFTVRDAEGNTVPVNISCLAPSEDDCKTFLDQTRTSSILNMGLGTSLRLRQQCNRISVITRVDFGKTRIMLGGDAEHGSWRQVLSKYPREQLESNLVKISHHGSPTGTSRELAAVLSKGESSNQDTIALVTPSFSHHLPTPAVLEVLREHFDEVIVTRERGEPPGDVDRFRGRFPAAKNVVALPGRSPQVVSVVFDAFGNRVPLSSRSPA